MPGFDKTGSEGQGAGTGRGRGGCLIQPEPDSQQAGRRGMGRCVGRGAGCGMRRMMGRGPVGGRGVGRQVATEVDRVEHLKAPVERDERFDLQNQIDSLKIQLSEIKDLLVHKESSKPEVTSAKEPQNDTEHL